MSKFFDLNKGNKRSSICRVLSQSSDNVFLREMFFGDTGVVKGQPFQKYDVGTVVKVHIDTESFNKSSWIETI